MDAIYILNASDYASVQHQTAYTTVCKVFLTNLKPKIANLEEAPMSVTDEKISSNEKHLK